MISTVVLLALQVIPLVALSIYAIEETQLVNTLYKRLASLTRMFLFRSLFSPAHSLMARIPPPW